MLAKLNKLPEPVVLLIRELGIFADARRMGLYLVGGCVRDCLLGAGHFDLDFVVEGDGIAFAEAVAGKWGVKATTHKRFGTATLMSPAGLKIDIATSRREMYEKPGALPVVAPGTLRDDLFRRDFTINAMALCVNPSRFAQLIDNYGGQKDLKAGCVRALHALSFMDDPTRILRAVRFEQRLGFVIEKNTFAVLREAVRAGMLERVQKHRLRDELLFIFQESGLFEILRRLHQAAGFGFISPSLRWESSWRGQLAALRKIAADWGCAGRPRRRPDGAVMSLALILARLPLKEARRVMLDFAFHREVSGTVLSVVERGVETLRRLSRPGLRPSEVYRLLEPLSTEAVLLMPVLSASRTVARHVADFLDHHNAPVLCVTGEDLQALGLKPGPRYKEILRELLYAKIDGRVSGKDAELAWVKNVIMPTKGS